MIDSFSVLFPSILTRFDIFKHRLHAHVPNATHLVRTGPESTAPKKFLHFGEVLKHSAGSCPF